MMKRRSKADDDAVKAFLAKGGKIKKLPPGKAQGYHGKDDPGAGMKGMLDKGDTKKFKTRKKIRSMESFKSYVSEDKAGKSLADKSKKSGISTKTLRKVYNRGVAAWKTGHRPGTTPSQWGHARVNAFIVKKKKGGLNHDKDLA